MRISMRKDRISTFLIGIGIGMLVLFIIEVVWANVSPGGFEYNFVSRRPPVVVLAASLAHLAGLACLWTGFRLRGELQHM